MRLSLPKLDLKSPQKPLLLLISAFCILAATTILANNNINARISEIDGRLNRLIAKGLASTLLDSFVVKDFATSERVLVRAIGEQDSVSSISLYDPEIGRLFSVHRNEASGEVDIEYGAENSVNDKSSQKYPRTNGKIIVQPIANGQNVIGRIKLSLAADSVANKAASVVKTNVLMAFGTSSILFLVITFYFFHDQKSSAIRKALEKNNKELEAAKQAAEEANGYKDLFVSKLSHELRTPLNAILGTVHILNHKPADTTCLINELYINRIKTAANHLLGIANDILDMASIKAGKLVLRVERSSLTNLIRNCSDIVKSRLSGQRISFLIEVAEDVPVFIRCDQLRLRQVLINLLSNAIKATDSGRIVLRVYCESQANGNARLICFRVEDTGIGISQSDQKLLFQPFVRIDRSHGKEGTGLGLSISRSIVAAMGGTIECESRLMKGSAFTVQIPLKPDATSPPILPKITSPKRMVAFGSKALESFIQPLLSSLWNRYSLQITLLIEESCQSNDLVGTLVNADFILIDSTVLHEKPVLDAMRSLFLLKTFQGKVLIAETTLSSDTVMREPQWQISAILQYPLLSLELHDYFARQSSLAHAERDRGASESGLDDQPLNRAEACLRVLLVDDNQTNLDVTKEILDLAGFEIETALSGRAALRLLDRSEQVDHAFDLIILDINMPGIDGYQTLCQIRKKPAWEKIPVIALTAYGDEADVAKTRAAGFYSHLVKPVDPRSMYEIIYRATKTPSLQLTDAAMAAPQNTVSIKENQFLALTNAGFDVGLALNRMRGRTKTYRRLIGGFYDDYSSLLNTSSNEYNSTNLEEWTRTVHSIKGLSGMMGATSLMEACAVYELALKKGGTSQALFANFSDELKRALCGIKKVLEEYPSEHYLGPAE